MDFIEGVNILSTFHTHAKPYGKVQNRKSNSFMFRIKGSAVYIFDNVRLTAKVGEVLYIPQGSSYELFCDEDDSNNLYTSINFRAEAENAKPVIYNIEDFYEKNYIYENFSENWRFGTLSDKYKCISVFYNFLAYITRLENRSSSDKNKYHLIEPAIDYLKSHLFDKNLKTDNLSRLCCLSDTYFRKLFVLRFNISPKDYVINRRISHAKSIIESGDYDNISEVAEMVGYTDPLYFSKAFKKIYGISPSVIKNN